MRTLTREEVDGRDYRDVAEARESIGVFLEQVYNRQRLHSALAYRPPKTFKDIADWTNICLTPVSHG